MIQRLREATKKLHEEVEKENPAAAIIEHNITKDAYRHLLLQNYVAYEAAEKEISRFLPDLKLDKHLLISKDLAHLNIFAEEYNVTENFKCHNLPQALGAAYVVEGSAMGGMVLAKHLKKCSLENVAEFHFFSGDKAAIQDWNRFKEMIESSKFTPEEEEQMLEKAQQTFLFFKKVFRQQYFIPA